MKAMMKKRGLAVAVFMLGFSAWIAMSCLNTAAAPKIPGNPPARPGLDTAMASVLHEEFNFIQFYSRSALEHFRQAWNDSKTRKLSIVHLGDSHCQLDQYPGELRRNLQALLGDGGRGVIFPYSTAKSYCPVDYSSTHSGDWTFGKSMTVPSKLPLGVIGMTSNTVDPKANFTITFKEQIPANYTRLKIFVKKQHDSYDLSVNCGNDVQLVSVDSLPGDTLPYYELNVKPNGDAIHVDVVKNNDYESELEFYGMSLETESNTGVILHNCGVGASRYQSILYEDLFPKQLPTLKPDLVILDFGTNDYLYDDSLKAELPDEIRSIIKEIRGVAPDASILLTTTMDMNYKGFNVRSGEAFSDMTHRIARETGCGVYDWFWIAGGNRVMTKWANAGYGRPDNIHLTAKGYKLKGDLLFEAMENTIAMLNKDAYMDSLVMFTDSLRAQQKRLALVDTSNGEVPGRVMIHHRVKSGESLSMIAHRYGVSVADIKKWNKLRSNMIHPGQTLIIYKKKK